MNNKHALVGLIIFSIIGNYVLIADAMEQERDSLEFGFEELGSDELEFEEFEFQNLSFEEDDNYERFVEEKCCALDSVQAKIAIDTYDESTVRKMDEKVLSKFSLAFFTKVCEKIFYEFGRRDVLLALLNDKIFQNKNGDFGFIFFLVDLFYNIKSHLDGEELRVAHAAWDSSIAKLQDYFLEARKQCESSLPNLEVDLKAKRIVKNFKEHQSLTVGRLYESSLREEAYSIAEKSDELLMQILVYIFSHFEEHLHSLNEAIELIEFIFPEGIDLNDQQVNEILLSYLSQSYPTLVNLVDKYNYLKEWGPQVMELISYLKSDTQK